jgi:hypothetical protein
MKNRMRTSWATRTVTPVLLPKDFQSLPMAMRNKIAQAEGHDNLKKEEG